MVATRHAGPLRDVLKGVYVIDCDTHYTEPPDLWTSRAPTKYKDRVPYLKRVNGEDRWYVEGDKFFGDVGSTVVSHDDEKVYGPGRGGNLTTWENLSRAAYDPQARLALMDRLGIYAQIVYPNAAGLSSVRFIVRVKDVELRTACIKIYNDAVAELQQASGGRLLPQALLPVWDLDETLREVRRIKEELHLTGLVMSDYPEGMGLPDYGNPYWDPFWELCNDLRLPLNFHIGGRGNKAEVEWQKSLAWASFGQERRLALQASVFLISNATTIGNFVYSGILDRYPNLKLVSVESGIGWIPFVLEALEYQLDEMVPTECRHLQRRPKEYFRDHWYACFWFEDFGPRALIEQIGPNNILFETDFPHPTCLYPKAQQHIADVLRDLRPEVRRRVLQDNASELYGITLPTSAA